MEYAAPVFHHSLPQYLVDDLERVQQRSLAIIFKCDNYSQWLEYSGIDTLANRRQMLCSKLFDAITSNPDHKLYKLLPPKKKQTYNLRHKRSFSYILARSNPFQKTFIPHIWLTVNIMSSVLCILLPCNCLDILYYSCTYIVKIYAIQL